MLPGKDSLGQWSSGAQEESQGWNPTASPLEARGKKAGTPAVAYRLQGFSGRWLRQRLPPKSKTTVCLTPRPLPGRLSADGVTAQPRQQDPHFPGAPPARRQPAPGPPSPPAAGRPPPRPASPPPRSRRKADHRTDRLTSRPEDRCGRKGPRGRRCR